MSDATWRRLGLVGGTSWVSSTHYYRRLNAGVAARRGGSSSAPVTLWSVEFGEIARLQHDGDWVAVGRVLADAARQLVDAGCEGIALAANTTHLVADAVRDAIGGTEFVDLVGCTATAVAGYGTVGLLGTSFTMGSDLFPAAFAGHGTRVVVPEVDDRAVVHDAIYDELVHDELSDVTRKRHLEIIDRLVDDGAEAVVLACTEQGLLLHDGDASVPLLDTTEIHCRALVDFMLGESS